MQPSHPEQPIDDPEYDSTQPSKSQRKRDSHDLQDLGEELVALSDARLAELELPERLRAAILEARRISKFGALRRQMQYVGKLMRAEEVDVSTIRARLDAWKGLSREATAHMHLLERWRDRLVADDESIGELAERYPGGDLQRLRTLVRNARKEHAAGLAPASYRQLFQALKEIIPEPHAHDPRNDQAETA